MIFRMYVNHLKNYTRNGGGKKYFMFSPLSLFADACSSDASDAIAFDAAVNDYLKDNSIENQKRLRLLF